MRNRLAIILLGLLGLLLLGCVIAVPQPTPTPAPPAAPLPTTAPSPTAEPTPQPTASPTPKPSADPEAGTERYEAAMRDGYADALSDLEGLTRYRIKQTSNRS